jgi:hypothetical protein
MVENPRYPHTLIIERKGEDATNPFVDVTENTVIYDDCCRSYTQTRTSVSGDVITNQRIIAVPKNVKDWTAEDLPKTGDLVTVTKGVQIEEGVIVDVRPNNFGTDIAWEYGRN